MISLPSHQRKFFYIEIQNKMLCRPQSNSRMCMMQHLAIRVGYKCWIEQSGNIEISILRVESTIQRNTESALRIWHIEFCCLSLLSISCFILVQRWEKVIDLYTDPCDFISDFIAFANYLHNDTIHYWMMGSQPGRHVLFDFWFILYGQGFCCRRPRPARSLHLQQLKDFRVVIMYIQA